MIKSQSTTARFKTARPFPLHRLPSLLKRSLSVSHTNNADTDGTDLAPLLPPNVRSSSINSHVLLDLLPSVRSNQFVWTYTRLLCTSASYIAGMSFYNFIAALLSLSHDQMKIYDVLGSSHPTHSRRKLLLAWTSTSALIAAVVVVVYAVVRMSEKKFAYQIHREVEKMERIEARIRRQQSQPPVHAEPTQLASIHPHPSPSPPPPHPQTGASPLPSHAAAAAVEESRDGSEDEYEDDDDDDEEEAEVVVSFAPLPPSQRQTAAVQTETIGGRHTELMTRVKAEEDKRAVCRALISASTHQTEEEIEEDEDAEDALEEALQAGLSAQEIARQASSQRRLVIKHDPISRISSSSIFLYRLCDLVCYYIIFVAVYAFQNTLQLSIHTNTLLWSSAYFLGLLVVALLLVSTLEGQQESIGRSRLLQEEKSQSFHDRINSRRLKRLKIRQASWRKLSAFVASSFAYLLA